MYKQIEGTGLMNLTHALEEINLSQRGKWVPKRILVSYEYDSLSEDFSITVRELDTVESLLAQARLAFDQIRKTGDEGQLWDEFENRFYSAVDEAKKAQKNIIAELMHARAKAIGDALRKACPNDPEADEIENLFHEVADKWQRSHAAQAS